MLLKNGAPIHNIEQEILMRSTEFLNLVLRNNALLEELREIESLEKIKEVEEELKSICARLSSLKHDFNVLLKYFSSSVLH